MNEDEMDYSDAKMLRKKAEEQLKKKQMDKSAPAVENGVMKLLHELQVHQIELEMQNEELREANETAEAALKKYTMLYDFAPMGYFTLNSEGNICELNFTGAEMLGYKRSSLINRNFKLFISEDSLPVFNKFFNKVFAINEKEACNLKLAYNNKPLCSVYMEGIVTDDDRKCLLSAIDLSAFKE